MVKYNRPASVFYVPHQRGRIVKNLGMDKNGGRDRELMGRTLDRRQSMRYERPGVGHIEYWGRRKMGLCRVMLQAYRDFRDGVDCELEMPRNYDEYDLEEGIQWVEDDEKHTHFPHDDDVDYEGFKKWAENKLNEKDSINP